MSDDVPVPDVTTLDRPLYGFHQVDGLLQLRAGTARRWIDGYARRGLPYPPVIRVESTGVESVTWGEFVEVSLLAQYRDAGVPMQRLRPVVQTLRKELGVQYPLAHQRPWVADRDLVIAIQQMVGLEPELHLVYAPRTGQVRLTERAEGFFGRVEWIDDIADSFRVGSGDNPARLHPLRSFGVPTIGGIRTDVIAELRSAGESPERVARTYGLEIRDVEAAVDFEFSHRAA
jgi:uncharacterized protein (DUF433 family)